MNGCPVDALLVVVAVVVVVARMLAWSGGVAVAASAATAKRRSKSVPILVVVAVALDLVVVAQQRIQQQLPKSSCDPDARFLHRDLIDIALLVTNFDATGKLGQNVVHNIGSLGLGLTITG